MWHVDDDRQRLQGLLAENVGHCKACCCIFHRVIVELYSKASFKVCEQVGADLMQS